MPDLHLIAADLPLRAALAEQLKLGSLGDMLVLESEALPAPAAGTAVMLILDAPLVTPALLKSLRDQRIAGNAPKLFILGEAEGSEGLVTESFPKPLRLGHLLARLQFYLQGARLQGEPILFGPFSLEPAARQVTIADTDTVIRLTEKETHLLEYLGRSKKPVTRDELLAAIWGYDARIDTHTLETHIYHLRRKLDPDSRGAKIIIADQGCYCLAGGS